MSGMHGVQQIRDRDLLPSMPAASGQWRSPPAFSVTPRLPRAVYLTQAVLAVRLLTA
jgi:hypothetical protein